MVSEDDCEDRDNRQPRHQARGPVSAGQVRAQQYQHGRHWNISLRDIITCLSEDTICIRSCFLIIDMVLPFLPIFTDSSYFLLWNTVKKWSPWLLSNALAKRPLTAHNYLPGRKWWCFLLSSILSFFVGVFSVLFIRACAAVFCRKVKLSLKKMWNHSKCFNSIWNILIKFLLSKCIYIEVKS